jgi:hypothetical protein
MGAAGQASDDSEVVISDWKLGQEGPKIHLRAADGSVPIAGMAVAKRPGCR